MAKGQHFNKLTWLVAIITNVGFAHAQTPTPEAVTSDQPSTEQIHPSQSPAQLTEMDLYALYAEASKLHDAGEFDKAYERYVRIWTQKRGYDVAASMGDIELRRGHYALAASHFRYALDHMPVTQNKLYFDTLQAGFDKARPHVAEARLTTHPVVAGVQVSNAKTGERYDQPFYLTPGHHTLKIMAPGYRVALQDVTAAEAATLDLDAYLTATDKPVSAPTARTTKRRHPELVFPIGGAVTLGLAAAATGSFIDAQSKHDDLRSLDLGPSECVNRTSARCAQADELGDKAEGRETLAWALTGGAVIAASATVLVWWLWESDVPVDVGYERNNREISVRWTHAF